MPRKPIKDINQFRFQFVRETLRRATFRWPPGGEARKLGRTEQKINPNTGRLCWHARCAKCQGEFLEKIMELDHHDPVIPIPGSMCRVQEPDRLSKYNAEHLGNLVFRMFPEVSGYQLLCHSCHSIKTNRERKLRKAWRKG